MTKDKTEIEKLNLNSMNIADEKRNEILQILPEIRTEGGKIDFDKLKLILGELIDTGKERYGMNWAGKAECSRTIQTPSSGTFTPDKTESIDFETTDNLIIEGDNLESLKLLQKSYLGKIKAIYIDPPYNTGSDFIYPDNYSESLQTYLQYTGQTDSEGRKFGTNTDTDGRFHSKWMNMMYTRLFLAKNLLKEDGLILVSIDDNEVKGLRSIMDEIFGEENFIDTIIWKKRYGGGAKEKYLVSIHEYILVYARSKDSIENIYVPLSEASIERYYKLQDDNFEKRGPFRTHPLESMKSFEERENLKFGIPAPDGTTVMPKRQWRWGKPRVEEALKNGELHFTRDKNNNWVISTKQYLKDGDEQRETKFFSLIDDVFTQHGTNEIVELFGDAQVFGFPKPSKLIKKLIQVATNPKENDIVLDFFAGSGSTGQAVLELNQEDGGNRKFILVQLPEPTGRKDFPLISDITRARVKKISQAISESTKDQFQVGAIDTGFRFFKLKDSCFKSWENSSSNKDELGKQLEIYVDHIKQDRSSDDIFYEILLKSGFPLTTKVETQKIGEQTVYSIAGGMLLVCLEDNLTLDLIKHIADQKPERVVCLDQGFSNNDQLKANAVQIFKTKGIASFKTV